MSEPWSDPENDLIVADYFAMLVKDVSGQPYNKSQHRRALMAATGRGKGSVEFKHQNLSAVMIAFGKPWIKGYRPLFNFQATLAEAVARHLETVPLLFDRPQSPHLAEASPLWVGTPPTMRNAPDPVEAEQLMAIARKYDIAGRDAQLRALGLAGERRVMAHEQVTLRGAGRDDLADKVRWTSQEDGDGAGYDIASFTTDGHPRLIEVKTTNGWDRTPFHISPNELDVAQNNTGTWYLFRLYDFARTPKAFELRPPLERHVALTPTSFRADLR